MNETTTLQLKSSNGDSTQGKFSVHQWDRAQGQQKALLWAGLIFGGGMLTIFIPIVHFVSVPATFLITPVVYIVISKLFGSGLSYEGSAKCPGCQNEFLWKGSSQGWPVNTNCEGCRGSVQLNPA